MKKTILVGGIALAALVLSGCGAKKDETVAPQAGAPVAAEQGIVERVKDAVTGTEMLKCESQSGQTKTVTYYRLSGSDLKMRSEMTIITQGKTSKTYSVVTAVKDEFLSYSWSDEPGSKAMKMDSKSACMQEMQNNPAVKEEIEKSKKEQATAMDESKSLADRLSIIKAEAEKELSATCSYSSDSVDFSAPKGVEFVDFCQLFGDLSKMMEQYGQ